MTDPVSPLPPPPPPPPAAARPGLRRRCHRGGERRVGVVRPEGRAVGAELQLRRRRHRPARSERRRQDHAHARHHRPHPGEPGQRRRRRAVAPSRPLGVRAPGPRPRGRSGAARPARRASSAPTWPTCTASPTAGSSTGRSTPCRCSTAADRSMDGFSKGMRQRSKVAAALVKNPLVLVLDEPLNGADPVQRAPAHRAVPAPRRRGAHGDRQLPRAARGRGDGGAGDRDRPGPAGRRRRAPGDPRRHGRRAPPAPRAGPRRARPGGARSSATTRWSACSSTATTSSCPPPEPRTSPCCSPGPPATSACTSSRCVPSTTRSRACSGSWSGERHRHPARRRREPSAPSSRYTLRSALPGKRWIGALAPGRRPSILFGLLATTLTDTADCAFVGVAADSLFMLVLPVTCLVIGDAVLGAEVRSGTFAFTWMSPVPTWQITARPLVGRHHRGGRHRSPIAFALSAVVAGAPGAGRRPRPSRARSARRPTSRCSSPSAASPSGRRCGRSRS